MTWRILRWALAVLVAGLVLAAPAHAAKSLEYFCGWELQNEWESTNENVTAAQVKDTFDSQCEGVEEWSLEIGGSGAVTPFFTGHEWACDTTHENIAGAYVQFHNDHEPPAAFVFLRGVDSKNAAHWELAAYDNPAGDSIAVALNDGTGTFADGIGMGFALGEWYLFEVRWQAANNPDGYCYVYVNGVLWASDAAGDYLGGIDAECAIGAIGQPLIQPSPTRTRYGSMYGLYDTSGAADLLGDYEVVGPFQTCSNDSAIDAGSAPLDTGPWSNFGETPYNGVNKIGWNSAQWGVKRTDDSDDCARDGPNGDARVRGDDDIIGASWVFQCGVGSNAPIYGRYNGAVDSYVTGVGGCTNRTPPRYYVVGSASAQCPDSDDWFVLGDNGTAFGVNGMEDGWAFLLQKVSADTAIMRRRIDRYGNDWH